MKRQPGSLEAYPTFFIAVKPNSMNPQQQLIDWITRETTSQSISKAVFSVPRTNDGTGTSRVDVRPIEVQGKQVLQFTSQTSTQQFHQNLTWNNAIPELIRLATTDYRNTNIVTPRQTLEATYSRKGKCLVRETKSIESPSQPITTDASHNRVRNHLIPDGVPCPFLIETGIMTPSGKVIASHMRKFKQINRYLEFIHDVADKLPSDRPIHVVDFGCGKSYLTFATQYLLSTVLKRECIIIGLDRRRDVVETCQRIAQSLGLRNVHFEEGDIAGYRSSIPQVDMVVSLHACDTATDDALVQAICWNANVILAVPCCQHELNRHLSSTSLSPLTQFGLAKERFAALATDAMRAALLGSVGYQTQMLEFIETEHTPKNILLRAVRRKEGSQVTERAKGFAEVTQMREMLGVPSLTLERHLQNQSPS
jgi:SAM-dependent methyltransferase